MQKKNYKTIRYRNLINFQRNTPQWFRNIIKSFV